jgi:hypothetical protein
MLRTIEAMGVVSCQSVRCPALRAAARGAYNKRVSVCAGPSRCSRSWRRRIASTLNRGLAHRFGQHAGARCPRASEPGRRNRSSMIAETTYPSPYNGAPRSTLLKLRHWRRPAYRTDSLQSCYRGLHGRRPTINPPQLLTTRIFASTEGQQLTTGVRWLKANRHHNSRAGILILLQQGLLGPQSAARAKFTAAEIMAPASNPRRARNPSQEEGCAVGNPPVALVRAHMPLINIPDSLLTRDAARTRPPLPARI